MPTIQLTEPRPGPQHLPLRPFALGFRPFFLLAGIASVVLLGLWLVIWQGLLPVPGYYPLITWHAHEMLFGYTVAVIAGFLLTAARNWSGVDTATGIRLAGLAAVWLAGRVLPFIPQLPDWSVAMVDLAFLPLLGLSLVPALFASGNKGNRLLLVLLLVMTGANALVHLELLGFTATTSATGIQLMLNTILLLIIMIAGRVMPFFTEAALPGTSARQRPLIERAGATFLIMLILFDLASLKQAAGIAAALLALIQFIRLAGWYQKGVARVPVLLVLYVAYGWLIVGFGLKALTAFDLITGSLAVHAFTVGGIGVITLGMMSRVALGHTGRAMQTSPWVNSAFALLAVAAITRALLPAFHAGGYPLWINISGGLWILGWLLFLGVYTPILLRARIDGKPG